jgi:hypothetical protein
MILFVLHRAKDTQRDLRPPDSENLLGDMPLKSRFGYLFSPAIEGAHQTIAHELAHVQTKPGFCNAKQQNPMVALIPLISGRAFQLRHTFSERYSIAKNSTPNLMDYARGSELTKYQWDLIHDPESMFLAFLQDEKEGAWLEGVHNIIIDSAFVEILSPEEILILKNSSKAADGPEYQTQEYCYRHAMRGRSQNMYDAIVEFNFFLVDFSIKYIIAKDNDESLAILGFVLHALMDSKSPSHAGFQVWDGMCRPASWLHWVGDIEENNEEEMQQAATLIKEIFLQLRDIRTEYQGINVLYDNQIQEIKGKVEQVLKIEF